MAESEQDADARLGQILAARKRGDAAYLIDGLRDPDNRSFAAMYLGELWRVRGICADCPAA